MKVFAITLLSVIPLFAALPSEQVQDSVNAKLENIESRRGLEIGGTVRSVMFRSAFSSDQDINAYDKSPDTERNGFSQFDLKLGARPFDLARGDFVLRMAANYQDYFQMVKTTVTVPWIHLEGQVSDFLFWQVGDFRSEYSPLTLHSPNVEVLYEPEIYRRARHIAQDQVFLDGNKRNLQGANLQFRRDFGDLPGELRVEGIFSRLRRYEVLDFGGAVGNILPNEQYDIPGASQSSGMDKLLYSGNLEWLPFSKNAFLGFTPIFIKDLKTSTTLVKRKLTVVDADGNEIVVDSLIQVNPGVLGPENAQIFSARIGADVAGFLGNENLIANLIGEYAMSKDDYYSIDETNLDADGIPLIKSTELEGQAILAQLAVGYQNKGSWFARIDANYIMNDSGWYNPLAQSPAFFPRRVANSDKDGDILKYGARSPFYSTFDALYHFNPKFMPVDKKLSTGGGDQGNYAPTESYQIAPFSKNSYNTAVYTRDELSLLEQLADPVLQSALPNGLATANRVGPKADLTVAFGESSEIEFRGLFAALQQSEAVAGAEKAKFNEFGGGAKADIGSLLWGLPLEVSGSYKNSKSEFGEIEFTSNFINAGFYARFFKRFGFSAGFQAIGTDSKNAAAQANTWHLGKGDQKQWMAGLDYTLAKNAWLAINFGQIIVDNTYKTDDPENATGLLPSYIVTARDKGVIPKTQKEIKHKFQQNLVEASINVDF